MIELYCDIRHVNGEARGTVTARHADGQTLHVDTGNWLVAATRKRFCGAVAQKVELPELADEVEALLLAKLDEGRVLAGNGTRDGFDVSRVVRPDLFITPQVIGLTVPHPLLLDGRPAAQWLLH